MLNSCIYCPECSATNATRHSQPVAIIKNGSKCTSGGLFRPALEVPRKAKN